ncbi:aminotransferase class III-fold pyridoxal phosphate-dependent enzyme [Paenibacillus sp. HJL G12]|uniref:alanine--glyoxylate transaminase n=1 Tax=Paenibacillus dendrobii TaxID=2691084 RepID=A0A7X3LJU6_9BACL|nr:aspartate aminotransferase family protein [Paenibacillus dendrobii]MWV45769.1 aminotransferase class III-fold pyridoxal phosphate-dependent enzyme [Paenibacillus dendrobii]
MSEILKSLDASSVEELRRQYFYPCTQHFYKRPPLIVRGVMQYLFDAGGRRYTDFFAGVSVVACGHCNPVIAEAAAEQLKRLQHTSTIYLTEPNALLAERLAELLPGDLRRTFFVNSGTEANEGALLLARRHTGRKHFIALEHSLHGRSHLTMEVTGLAMWRSDPFLEGNTAFIPRPFQPGLTPEEAELRSLEALDRVLAERGHEIAAMIVEPIQGNGGMIIPPAGYFREVRRRLDRYGILLIADEIQTGFGRTGRLFAMEHFGTVPDIMTMAKALGNGVPVAAFSATDAIAASMNQPSASTFGGNPVAAVTALAVLDYIRDAGLVSRSKLLGETLQAGLMRLKERHEPLISNVRGRGLMVGAEISGSSPEESAQRVDRVLEEMKDRGYIIGKNGVHRNVLAFQPPLVVTGEDIRLMLDALDQVLASIQDEMRPSERHPVTATKERK